ncbi:hypothetical protein Y694_04456 [Methylibium sp. T29-B]|nr:hypothetical protein Y694_04456 [Methylibium sp. T29-B]
MPPSARSKRPARDWCAPVNAPFSTPNSSLSSSSAGKAAQFSATKACAARGLAWCSARANISLPTPVSPSSSTVVGVAAARSASAQAARKAGERPISSCGSTGGSAARRSAVTWLRSATISSTTESGW